MTVKELIAELQNCENQDALVTVYAEDGELFDIYLVDDGMEGHTRVDLNIKELK